jgi:putative two-component system response regulator
MRTLIQSLVQRHGDRCFLAADAAAARLALAREEVELVLCDVDLGGESGLDLVRWLHVAHPTVAVVMVTGNDDAELAETALGIGAYGYVVKPFRTNEMLIAIHGALRRRSIELASEADRGRLESDVVERTATLASIVADLANAEEETIRRLALAAELRNVETGRHVVRVSHTAGLLAQRLGLDPKRCELMRTASQLHDIGKIGIPDEILLKAGPLSAAERSHMERHPEIGHRILSESGSPLLQAAAELALGHHEWWDGTGYPFGLAGERISIESRIVAVADVFDALTTARPYRPALSVEAAVAMMIAGRGSHFDPDVLDAFLASLEDVLDPQDLESSPRVGVRL